MNKKDIVLQTKAMLRPPKKARKAASSKDDCPACKNTEGSILLEKLDNSLMRSYCANHAPSTSRGKSGGSSVYSSASDSSSGTKLPSYKRQQSFDNQLDFSLSKRRCQGWKRRISDDSTNSEFNEPGKEPMDMFAPLDSDLEENANSVPKGQFIRQHSESCAGPALGSARADESRNKDEDETLILSDSESESLLLPVEVCMFDSTHSRVSPHSQPVDVPTAGFVSDGPSKEQGCDKSPESVDHSDKRKSGPPKDPKSPLPLLTTPVRAPLPSRASPQSSSSSSSAAPPTSAAGPPACATQLLDSTSFWKWCNTARCTEAIFTGFINEMTSISRRIQSDQASQDDRDVALKVMKASGKLEELIAKQHAELQRKQEELQQAAAALDEVASALRKPHQC